MAGKQSRVCCINNHALQDARIVEVIALPLAMTDSSIIKQDVQIFISTVVHDPLKVCSTNVHGITYQILKAPIQILG